MSPTDGGAVASPATVGISCGVNEAARGRIRSEQVQVRATTLNSSLIEMQDKPPLRNRRRSAREASGKVNRPGCR